jgi:hypothetical protein
LKYSAITPILPANKKISPSMRNVLSKISPFELNFNPNQPTTLPSLLCHSFSQSLYHSNSTTPPTPTFTYLYTPLHTSTHARTRTRGRRAFGFINAVILIWTKLILWQEKGCVRTNSSIQSHFPIYPYFLSSQSSFYRRN